MGHVVRYLDREPSARKAGANDSESLIPDRHGQNVWGIAVGRKNWLHLGSEEAGPKIAAIFSIVESCRKLDIPIRQYLADILPGLAERSIQSLAELAPANYAANRVK
ncbi:MAG: hypothetical protein P4L10_13990 [Acidobacteriaceae bacterium]|nr:hypothetical protein [Acidobacteriaceae bacterium]